MTDACMGYQGSLLHITRFIVFKVLQHVSHLSVEASANLYYSS